MLKELINGQNLPVADFSVRFKDKEILEVFPGSFFTYCYNWQDFAMRVSITLQENLRDPLLSLGNALGKEIQRRSKSLIAFLQVPSL